MRGGQREPTGPGLRPTVFSRTALGLFLLYSLWPIGWIALTSVKTQKQIFAIPPTFLVWPSLAAYVKLLAPGPNSILANLANSLIISGGATLATLVLGSLAAYAFSRYRFPGWRPLLLLMLATRLLPPITAVIPLFLLMSRMGLVDTHWVLILIYTALDLPFATWLMKAFFDAVPRELEEAAAIDGSSGLGTLWRITLPLATSGLAATAIFVFVLAWNEFMFAFIFTSVRARTMPVLIAQTLGEYQIFWQDMSSLATLLMLPTLAFGLFMQRYLIRGLTAGAIR